MSKELENLETLKDMLIGNGVNDNINDYVDNLILPIKQALLKAEKSLKALEIIKQKNVAVALLKSCRTINAYNILAFDDEYLKANNYLRKLTEEEFNLLKEVLE